MLLKLCVIAFNSLNLKNAQQNGGQRQQNEFQDYGQDSVVNNQGKTIRTIIHQTRNNLIIHLQNANGPIDISDDDLPF